jgi:MOSC domain-containing protein YiiM
MFQGRLEAIYIAPRKAEPTQRMEQAEAVSGRGLQGDRYFLRQGTFTRPEAGGADREVTLIEAEALEALARDRDVSLEPGQTRRNLVTSGVPLNHLVGKTFTVGEVVLRGVRLCEPCSHLEKLTVAGVKQGLVHRGGLRAQVVRGGILRAGDAIMPAAPEAG